MLYDEIADYEMLRERAQRATMTAQKLAKQILAFIDASGGSVSFAEIGKHVAGFRAPADAKHAWFLQLSHALGRHRYARSASEWGRWARSHMSIAVRGHSGGTNESGAPLRRSGQRYRA